MKARDTIGGSVASLFAVEAEHGHASVLTACLYPSNAVVKVTVQGTERFVVSDDAGGVHDVTAAGLVFPDPDRRLRHITRKYGLKIEKGVIYSPPVSADDLSTAIVLVANASKEAAHWGYSHLTFSVGRDFREELAVVIERATQGKVEHHAALPGASNKLYKFDYVVRRGGDRLIVIDPVMTDASSVYAKIVSHQDIKKQFQNKLVNRLVYDDREDWAAEDLNLLKMGGSPVPFTHFEEVFARLIVQV